MKPPSSPRELAMQSIFAARRVPSIPFPHVSIDTRTLEPGSLFVALGGVHYDGHSFLRSAYEKGAVAAVVQRIPVAAPPLEYYVVSDALCALASLARAARRVSSARVCAIAGSNGKTSTKDMLNAIAQTTFRVHATRANENNTIGVAQTILKAPADTEVLIVEVGTNAPGEVAQAISMLEPDVAIITSIGEEHLAGLRDLEGVLCEELSCLDSLDGGAAFLGDDPPRLAEEARAASEGRFEVRVAGFGETADADLRPSRIARDDEGCMLFELGGLAYNLPFRAKVQVRNAMLALGVARRWGIDAERARAALATMDPPPLRGELLRVGDLSILADCHNANPASFPAAIEMLKSFPAKAPKVAFVGSMLDLGSEGARAHAEVARLLLEAEFDLVVATGEFARAMTSGLTHGSVVCVEDPFVGLEALLPRLRGDEVILLKASRGVGLERCIPRLAEAIQSRSELGVLRRVREMEAGPHEGE